MRPVFLVPLGLLAGQLLFCTALLAQPSDEASPFVAPLPAGTTPSPTMIRVQYPGGELVNLDVSFGQASPFFVAALDSEMGSLFLDGDAYCPCPCGPTPCPECEPPVEVLVTLEADAVFEYDWGGDLARYRSSPHGYGLCEERFSPPAGRYLFGACTLENVCGVAEVSLPTAEPIEIVLGAGINDVTACPVDPTIAERAARNALQRMFSTNIIRDRIVFCDPESVTCVEPGTAPPVETVPHDSCALFIRPTGSELELHVIARLPADFVGGEWFLLVFDQLGIRISRVRYEQ